MGYKLTRKFGLTFGSHITEQRFSRVCCLSQDEVLFDSWDAIFNDGRMKDNVSIYSFDGKDVLRDSTW